MIMDIKDLQLNGYCTSWERFSKCYQQLRRASNAHSVYKDFTKERLSLRYNTFAKSCNSNLYTKYPGATYSGLLLGTICCL